MNIYETEIKADINYLVEAVKKIEQSTISEGSKYDQECDLFENYFDKKGIKPSAELVKKVCNEIGNEVPFAENANFIYVKVFAGFEEELGREPILIEKEKKEIDKERIMVDTKPFQVGKTVYVRDPWDDRIIKATLKSPVENGFHLDYKCFVDRNGKNIGTYLGTSGREFGRMWTSFSEAFLEMDMDNENKKNMYKEMIKDVHDLVRFPLDVCIGDAEEYTNYNARKAYMERASELGISLEAEEERDFENNY